MEESLEVHGHKGEDEGETSAREAKGLDQGDDVFVFCLGEDASFAERIMGRGALRRDGDFESTQSLAWTLGFVNC